MGIPSSDELADYLQSAKNIALAGGEILRNYWGKLTSIREKEFFWDLVTEADTESERIILELIQKKFPKHKTLSEEAGLMPLNSAEFLWVVDPLDGTTNYTHQYPMVSVSIGLLYKGKPIVGVVYNPIFNEMFCGAKGMGATLNDKTPLRVSDADSLDKSLLGTGFAYDRKQTPDTNYREFCHMTHRSQGVRRSGSAALDLSYVAAGRLDGFWERGLKPWDMAAGIVLIEEAGGRVSNYDVGPLDLYSGRILATNGKIHEILSREIENARQSLEA